MKHSELIERVRDYTRDDTKSLFPSNYITSFLNEAIDRMRQIPELKNMKYLAKDEDTPILLPDEFHYLLALYSVSRCYLQDEQNYPSDVYMREFSMRYEELVRGIKNGTIVIRNESGEIIMSSDIDDYVVDVYFKKVGDMNEY